MTQTTMQSIRDAAQAQAEKLAAMYWAKFQEHKAAGFEDTTSLKQCQKYATLTGLILWRSMHASACSEGK